MLYVFFPSSFVSYIQKSNSPKQNVKESSRFYRNLMISLRIVVREMGSNGGQGVTAGRYTISSTGTNDDDVIQRTYCAFSFLRTARPHTHTHTHNRVTNYSFTSFSNRDVFKYPGQTLLLACNKPCISVYTGQGGNVTNRFLARIERILSIRVSAGATNATRRGCKLRANVISKEKSFCGGQ